MKQARNKRIVSLQTNKENEVLVSNQPTTSNLPILRNNKQSFKNNGYHLNLNQRKKTYLNLCLKKDGIKQVEGETKKTIETCRGEERLLTQVSGTYFSSREKFRKPESQKYIILNRHDINIKMRARMIDWLLEITQAYKCKDQTLFLAIFLLDQYLARSCRNLGVTELHEIGITCMYMACKYEQVHPIRLKTFVRDIGHHKIPSRNIIARQADILKTIDFKFQRNCLYLHTEELLNSYTIGLSSSTLSFLRSNSIFLAKLIAFDMDLLREYSGLLSKAVLLAAIRALPQDLKNPAIYDSFISSCGSDYEACHRICSNITLLELNFRSEFGQVDNIHRLNPSRAQKNKKIENSSKNP